MRFQVKQRIIKQPLAGDTQTGTERPKLRTPGRYRSTFVFNLTGLKVDRAPANRVSRLYSAASPSRTRGLVKSSICERRVTRSMSVRSSDSIIEKNYNIPKRISTRMNKPVSELTINNINCLISNTEINNRVDQSAREHNKNNSSNHLNLEFEFVEDPHLIDNENDDVNIMLSQALSTVSLEPDNLIEPPRKKQSTNESTTARDKRRIPQKKRVSR